MVSVIIDGNYLFHKTFGIIAGYGDANPENFLSSKGDRDMFMNKIITDFCYSINSIPGQINKVIFCKDSRSWRKDFKITRSVYKEGRKKDENVDWTSFYKLMDEFGDFLNTNGFYYSSVNGAEGDDLLWYWNRRLRRDNNNVLMFTGDKDLHQLVGYDDKSWTISWNANSKNNKIACAVGWKDSIEKIEDNISIFDVTPFTSDESSMMSTFLATSDIEEIDIKEFVFKKILLGDKGDDVPSVYEYENAKGTISRITQGKADKIWEGFKQSGWYKEEIKDIWKNDEFLDWVSGFVLRSISENDTSDNRKIVKNNYFENAKLIWLNEETIPSDLYNTMEILGEDKIKESKIPILDKKTLLLNSPWGTEKFTPKKFDPFDLF